jgi:hypothetical protein
LIRTIPLEEVTPTGFAVVATWAPLRLTTYWVKPVTKVWSR